MLKNNDTLTRGAIVQLVSDAKTLSGEFKAGESFKFLGWYGGVNNLVRLSRVGDCAKLMVLPKQIGYAWFPPQPTVKPAERQNGRPADKYEAPHSDDSGASREIVIATVLAGKDSGQSVMHLTPAEEKEYNAGMAKMAELYPG